VENRWRKARGGGDLMSFKHVIVGDVEGGLDPYHLWAHNPPQATTYLSKNTMVPIVGPLRKINARVFYVPARKCDCRSNDNL
jgi:hypothetical protein